MQIELSQELVEKINTLVKKINAKLDGEANFGGVLEVIIEAGINHVEYCLKGVI